MNEKTPRPRHKGDVAVESGRPTGAPTQAPTQAPTTLPRPALTLPERKYFKIGEVAELVGVEPHVLRYWETQFSQLRPHKARSGHRLYRRREVETLLVIKELLHIQRFTIAGARQALRQQGMTSLLPRSADGADSVLPMEAEQLSLAPVLAREPSSTRSSRPAARAAAPAARRVLVEEIDDVDDRDDDIEDDEVELHLAGPMLRHAEVEIEIEARDGEDLDDALSHQLAEQLTAQGADRGVARVEVRPQRRIRRPASSSSSGSRRVAKALLLEAVRDLELVVQKLKR